MAGVETIEINDRQGEVRAEIALDITLVDEQQAPTNDPYEKTFFEWFNHLAQIIYVYDYVLERKKRRLNRMNLANTFFSASVTLIVVSQFGVDQCQYSSVLIALQVIMTVFSLTSTILGGAINVYGLTDIVNSIQRFLDSAESLYVILAGEQTLPIEIQSNKKDIVVSNKSRYFEILQTAPDINTSEYMKGLAAFEKSKDRFRILMLPSFQRVDRRSASQLVRQMGVTTPPEVSP
jgi:hypothetical protein